MPEPVGTLDVDLDIAGPGDVTDLHHGLPEIRSRVKIVKTRRHNAKPLPRCRPEVTGIEQFVFPNVMQKILIHNASFFMLQKYKIILILINRFTIIL
jgi:hypothetical protein